jgi:hypothetical protein
MGRVTKGPKLWTAWIWYYREDNGMDSIDSTGRRRIVWYPIVTVHPEVPYCRRAARVALAALSGYSWTKDHLGHVWVGPSGSHPIRKVAD